MAFGIKILFLVTYIFHNIDLIVQNQYYISSCLCASNLRSLAVFVKWLVLFLMALAHTTCSRLYVEARHAKLGWKTNKQKLENIHRVTVKEINNIRNVLDAWLTQKVLSFEHKINIFLMIRVHVHGFRRQRWVEISVFQDIVFRFLAPFSFTFQKWVY